MYAGFAELYSPESHTEQIAEHTLEDLQSLVPPAEPTEYLEIAGRRREDFEHSVAVQILHTGSATDGIEDASGTEHTAARETNAALAAAADEVATRASAYLDDPTRDQAIALGEAMQAERSAAGEIPELREWAQIDGSAYPMNQGNLYPPGIEYVRNFAKSNVRTIETYRGTLREQIECTDVAGDGSGESPTTPGGQTESEPSSGHSDAEVVFEDGFEDGRYDGWELIWFEDQLSDGDDGSGFGSIGGSGNVLNYWDVESTNAIAGDNSLHLIAESHPAGRATERDVLQLDGDFEFSYQYYFEDPAIGGPQIHLWDRDQTGSAAGTRLDPATMGPHLGSAVRPYDGSDSRFELLGESASVPDGTFGPEEAHTVRVERSGGEVTGYHDGEQLVSTTVGEVSADLTSPHKLLIVSGTGSGAETDLWLDEFVLKRP